MTADPPFPGFEVRSVEPQPVQKDDWTLRTVELEVWKAYRHLEDQGGIILPFRAHVDHPEMDGTVSSALKVEVRGHEQVWGPDRTFQLSSPIGSTSHRPGISSNLTTLLEQLDSVAFHGLHTVHDQAVAAASLVGLAPPASATEWRAALLNLLHLDDPK